MMGVPLPTVRNTSIAHRFCFASTATTLHVAAPPTPAAVVAFVICGPPSGGE
jgi:hypothetical protein